MSIPQILQMIQWTNTRIKYISPEVATIQNSNEIGKFSIKDRRTEQNRTEQNRTEQTHWILTRNREAESKDAGTEGRKDARPYSSRVDGLNNI